MDPVETGPSEHDPRLRAPPHPASLLRLRHHLGSGGSGSGGPGPGWHACQPRAGRVTRVQQPLRRRRVCRDEPRQRRSPGAGPGEGRSLDPAGVRARPEVGLGRHGSTPVGRQRREHRHHRPELGRRHRDAARTGRRLPRQDPHGTHPTRDADLVQPEPREPGHDRAGAHSGDHVHHRRHAHGAHHRPGMGAGHHGATRVYSREPFGGHPGQADSLPGHRRVRRGAHGGGRKAHLRHPVQRERDASEYSHAPLPSGGSGPGDLHLSGGEIAGPRDADRDGSHLPARAASVGLHVRHRQHAAGPSRNHVPHPRPVLRHRDAGVFLKGVGPSELWLQAVAMLVYAIVGLGLAARYFKKELEA